PAAMLALLADGAVDQSSRAGPGTIGPAAITTPAITTPAITTPAITTPAITTPAITTPGASTATAGAGAGDTAASPGGWQALAAPGAIAASPDGQHCQLTGLTAVAYTPAGAPLVGGSCAWPGVPGIFTRAGGAWQGAQLAVPRGQQLSVQRLTQTPGGDAALLRAGPDGNASLLAAWTADGSQWTVSASLRLGPRTVLASGTGAADAVWVLLSDGHGEVLPGPGAGWRELPALPRGTAALAVGTGGTVQALAVTGARLTVYQEAARGTWRKAQVITVPIQYGSSS
ncbi:MAG TPA: hypothetical protein VH478_25180, partial [Trebonia sp.]|nr:hypothetical protein [Trebonia sp.]